METNQTAKQSKGLSESVHCDLDSARGQYIPRDFVRSTKRECISGVKSDDLDYLARGPGGVLDDELPLADGESVRGEFYWDAWANVLDNAILTDPTNGRQFKLYQTDNGDLMLVPKDWEWDENSEGFRPPESETLMRFELPSYWASYLINADDSGISAADKLECDRWLEREELQNWTCADVSEHSWFAHTNDATRLGCDVAEYTFIKISEQGKEVAL